MEFLVTMAKSIISNDLYILIAAAITFCLIREVLRITEQVKGEVAFCHDDPQRRFAADLADRLNKWYNLFTTMITIFPLLGMLGTVIALIGIKLDATDTSFQQNFFRALTSTAWGIVFAIIFKVVNATHEYKIISQIEAAEKIMEKELTETIKNGVKKDEG